MGPTYIYDLAVGGGSGAAGLAVDLFAPAPCGSVAAGGRPPV